MIATAFGERIAITIIFINAIIPIDTSAIFQTNANFATDPKNTQATVKTLNINIEDFLLVKNSKFASP